MTGSDDTINEHSNRLGGVHAGALLTVADSGAFLEHGCSGSNN